MAALAAMSAGLQAAMLLAQGRPEGLRYVEPGLDGARRSHLSTHTPYLHITSGNGVAPR